MFSFQPITLHQTSIHSKNIPRTNEISRKMAQKQQEKQYWMANKPTKLICPLSIICTVSICPRQRQSQMQIFPGKRILWCEDMAFVQCSNKLQICLYHVSMVISNLFWIIFNWRRTICFVFISILCGLWRIRCVFCLLSWMEINCYLTKAHFNFNYT